jgi:phosphoribosylpyrophosphate synthetase
MNELTKELTPRQILLVDTLVATGCTITEASQIV